MSESSSLDARTDELSGAGGPESERDDDQQQVDSALGDIQVGGWAASLSRRSNSGRYTPDGA
jgi:hypothetical protein